MAGKRYWTEQIIVKLRAAELELGRGLRIPEACRALGQARSTQRHRGSPRRDEEVLVAHITALATQYGRYRLSQDHLAAAWGALQHPQRGLSPNRTLALALQPHQTAPVSRPQTTTPEARGWPPAARPQDDKRPTIH